MQKYKVAIIGCGANTPQRGAAGAIAYAHGWAYSKENCIDMVAACDLVEKNRLDYIAEMNIPRPYDDYKKMLEKEKIDILSICTYPVTHLHILRDAVVAGIKGVWLEKPISYDIEESREVARIAMESGVAIIVHQRGRLGGPFAWARKAIKQGRIGKVKNVQVTNCVDWWNDLYDVGCHTIDLVRLVIGDPMPVEVFASLEIDGTRKYKDGRTVENRCLVSVWFDNDVRFVMDCADKRIPNEPLIRVNGTDGFIELYLELPEGTEYTVRASFAGEPEMQQLKMENHFFGGRDNSNLYTEYALKDLLDAVETGKTPKLSPTVILPTMEIIDAIVRSSQSRATVRIGNN